MHTHEVNVKLVLVAVEQLVKAMLSGINAAVGEVLREFLQGK